MICPWSQFEPATLTFCEEGLCSWIRTPSDTWSNLMYIVVGILILYLTKKEKRWNLYGLGWAISALAVGVGSFLFHATQTFWAEFLDITGMFLFSGILVVGAADRYLMKPEVTRHSALLYGALTVASCLVLLRFHSWGIYIFIAHVVAFIGFEAAIFLRIKPWNTIEFGGGKFEQFDSLRFLKTVTLSNHNGDEIATKLVDVKPRGAKMTYQQLPLYQPLWWLFTLFGISFFFWGLDILGIWCSPSNHWITGHSMWHYVNAWCFLMAFRFYRYPIRNVVI